MDPGYSDVQKLVVSLRKSAKDDRVLLHYCGLGVPRPTASGDLWVFNRDYTEVRAAPAPPTATLIRSYLSLLLLLFFFLLLVFLLPCSTSPCPSTRCSTGRAVAQ